MNPRGHPDAALPGCERPHGRSFSRNRAERGTIHFVERGADHRFTDVVEELTLLVFSAPAEHSLEQAGSSQQ